MFKGFKGQLKERALVKNAISFLPTSESTSIESDPFVNTLQEADEDLAEVAEINVYGMEEVLSIRESLELEDAIVIGEKCASVKHREEQYDFIDVDDEDLLKVLNEE